MKPQGDATRKTKEGKEAIKQGRELTKRFRLNRKSTRAKLGIENPKKERRENIQGIYYRSRKKNKI